MIGETLEALQKAGIPKKQIRLDASKVLSTLNKHSGMTVDVFKQIPELLESPVIVVDSKKNHNARIIMGDLYDENGKMVTAALLLTPTSKKGNVLDVIKISSAEGRGHIQSLFRYENGTAVPVRYVDKKRIRGWLNVNRLQLPLHNLDPDPIDNPTSESNALIARDYGEDASNTFIPQSGAGVNTQFMQESAKNSENGQNAFLVPDRQAEMDRRIETYDSRVAAAEALADQHANEPSAAFRSHPAWTTNRLQC